MKKIFELPELPYKYSSLEPYIDAKTMEIHYSKHHKAYCDKFNASLEKYPKMFDKKAEEIISDLDSIPKDIKTAVINFGGGFVNHNFFWEILTDKDKSKEFNGAVADAISKEFGSLEEFKRKFSDAALGIFGSGWAWLVISDGRLEIIGTKNQDSPLSSGKIPILAIDVWEHAYYLKYQNRRAEFVEAFWNIINWKKVNELYEAAR